MKTFIAILTLNVAILVTGFGQDRLKDVRARVGNTEILKNWRVGEVKDINGVLITRLSGENDPYARTNVFYTPFSQIESVIEAKAIAENLSSEERTSMLQNFEKECRGGQVMLFFDRESEVLANMKMFTVTIMNGDETEVIYQKALLKESPYYYVQGIWYNYKVINLPYYMESSFVVMIKDDGLKQVYKFKVNVPGLPYTKPEEAIMMSRN